MVTKRLFGTARSGEPVTAFTIENDCGIAVTVLDYGATLQSLVLPHRGERIDVVLGYDTIEAYETNDAYLGATIGRFAGRIPGSVVRIGADAFPVCANEGTTHLHGGFQGFDKRIWRCAETTDRSVSLALVSPDGEEGYPGTVRTVATYTLQRDTLCITYRASADRTGAWNPTNHAYWNLNGHDFGDARGHLLEIPADRYVPVDGACLPLGTAADVTGTRFDFRTLRKIGDTYDHSFVLNGNVMRLYGSRGIGAEITTDCTAVQLYTAEFLTQRSGKGDAVYRPFGAVCLETEGRQTMPDQQIAPENVLSGDGRISERCTKYRFIFEEA